MEQIKKAEERSRQFRNELWEFLKEYSVIGLAIGVIVAQVSKDLVDSIVQGVFTPLLSLLIPGDQLSGLAFYIGSVRFDLGPIISALLTLVIVLVVLFIAVKKILKRDDLLAGKK